MYVNQRYPILIRPFLTLKKIKKSFLWMERGFNVVPGTMNGNDGSALLGYCGTSFARLLSMEALHISCPA